jgi:glycosyltransferase involved in cell wall biosynthesis
MKIVLIVEGVFPEKKGGLERWYKYLAIAFAKQGHSVTYINFSNVDGVRDGVHYKSIQNNVWQYRTGGVRSKLDSIQFALGAAKILKSLDFDVVYCSSVPILSVFTVWKVTRVKRRPVIFEWFEYWSFNYWIHYESKIFGLVGWFLQGMAIQLGNVRTVFNDKTRDAIRHGIKRKNLDLIRMMPGQCGSKSQIKFPEESEIRHDFIFVGRFVDEKQPNLAIECAVLLHDSGWIGNLKLFGTGPNLQKLKNLIQEKEASKYIRIMDNVTDEVINTAMDHSFVLFHPTKREGYGFVQVEAAFRGLPTILIHYPENASIELGINPELYAESDELELLASTIMNAYTRQREFRKSTQNWALLASQTRSSELSCETILEIMVELTTPVKA